jgi:DNA-binding beta-propeller fold protein YncE
MRTTAPKKIVWTNIAFLVLLVILMSTVINTASAKSLYVIADINGRPTPVQAYNIAIDGTLSFQVERSIPRYGWGAVGMAIDGDSKTLFVTYEESNRIQLINATTMADIGGTLAPGANNLAGIVYDLKKKLLYCVDRRTENLYVYNWDPNAITLTPVSGSPFTLTGASAYGIALDMTNDLLYVSNNNNKVRVYNTSDWSLARNISLSRMAVSIAVDVSRGFLYSGGGYVADDDFVTLYNPYLTRYNLATGTETAVQVEPNGGVIGLGVDTITGFIYITTARNNYIGGDNLKV